MSYHKVPTHWSDLLWLEARQDFLKVFSDNLSPATIDYSDCEWIDLHPLVDTQLCITAFCLSGGKVILRFFNTKDRQEPRRLVRFLIEAGFFTSFIYNDEVAKNIECVFLDKHSSLKDFIGKPEHNLLPSNALEQVIIVPCMFVDIAISKILTRDAVFRFCQDLRIKFATHSRLDVLGIAEPLMHEVRLFFNTVLPELIDNVRLHKRYDGAAQFSFFMRLRRRDDTPPYKARRAAEPDMFKRSRFAKATEEYWEHDIIEAAFSDNGSSIQESFIRAWLHKDPKKIPRKKGVRVDGHNGDFHIVKSILEENRSSLTEEERRVQGLPLLATGLHSLRRSIEGANFSFALRSGINYVLCTPVNAETNDNGVGKIVVRMGLRLPEKTPGVHYLFRIATLADRPLMTWVNGIPKNGIEKDPAWWESAYPERFEHVHFVDTYRIPETVEANDIIVCRAHHACPKYELYMFINEAHKRGANIILAEVPAPIALRIYRILQLIGREKDLCIPIITNSLRVKVAGNVPQHNAPENFALCYKSVRPYWWEKPSSPLHNLRELFLCSRRYDSRIIWEKIKDTKGAFVQEPVKWSRRWVLSGGFLSFYAILRSRTMSKILLRRMVLHIQVLGASDVLPSTDRLRHTAREIRGHSYLSEIGPAVLIDAVSVTGLTKEIAIGMLPEKNEAVFLPVFLYPSSRIEDNQGMFKEREGLPIRIFDWIPTNRCSIVWNSDGKPLNARLWRKGNSSEVTAKPKGMIEYRSKQGPTEAYAIWQRDGILEVGHFSYGRHHWFVWADLRRFVVERSADSQDMTESMLKTLERWQPAWIFYIPHETAESLVQRLWREAADKKLDISEETSWSLGDIAGFSTIVSPESADRILGNKVAVIIDDAAVTGRTIQSGKHKLKQLGFKIIHSMVMLDRQDPELFMNSATNEYEEHFAWWSLYIPETGTLRSCRICQGLLEMRKISDIATSGVIRDTLKSWIKNWQKTDSLQRFRNAIPNYIYRETLNKRLGDLNKPNIKIHISEAACAWSLEVAQRLEWYSFLAEGDDHGLGEALTESMSGVLLHYWDNLHDTYKRSLAMRLIDRMWADSRESARSLVAVCLMSLHEQELNTLSNLIKRKVCADGISNMDTTVFIYVVLSAVKKEKKDRIKWLKSLQEAVGYQKNQLGAEDHRKTISFLQALESTQISEIRGWDVLLSLGLPGRSSDHENIFSVIYRLKSSDKAAIDQMADLSLLKIFLEPIERCFFQQKVMFEEVGLVDIVEKTIKNFRIFCGDKEKLFDKDNLLEMIDDLNLVLNVGGKEFPSVRRAINAEYLHYLPFVVREQIKHITEKSITGETDPAKTIMEADYHIEGPKLLDAEDKLLKEINLPPAKRALILMPLHEEIVAISGKVPLSSAIRDCLLDVKHPKKKRLGFGEQNGTPYMKISFQIEPNSHRFDGHPAICIAFENKAEEAQRDEAMGVSWYAIQDYMSKTGAIAENEWTGGRITRRLWFRAYGKESGGKL